MPMAFTNRLATETSPYLLQHAHNPVDWYPWGEEALQKAKTEGKPILVSIGYAACHWCHVMERESFEDPETAALMNAYFVNIKIDREERPDLDHIYMDAVQVMTGSGGWPLNVFLTPGAKPFYGGTYFPPVRAHNRPSWKEVLMGVANSFREKNEAITTQAENLTGHLAASNQFEQQAETDAPFSREQVAILCENLLKTADRKEGGFGRAPKFPQSFSIQYLLRHYYFFKIPEAREQACLSLDKMIYGGIYDQVGGGFARYATDNEWLVPHFEKMLYDNALLVQVLSEAAQLTHKPLYTETIRQTMEFIEREMLSGEGGFYSAIDADSEGEEGRFYVWDKREIDTVLGEDASLFCAFYGVSEAGNWEGKNILHIPADPATFASFHSISNETLHTMMQAGCEKLLVHRNQRVRPLLDDKILLGWNALMNTACSKAFAATGNEQYRQLAIRNMRFLLDRFCGDDESFFHTYKNGKARFPAFLDDYAFLAQALINLQEISGDKEYLFRAGRIMEKILNDFGDAGAPYLFYTPAGQEDVIIRKKEVYDGAIPSGNAVTAGNLFYLSFVFDKQEWRTKAMEMVKSLQPVITRYPGSFGYWASLYVNITAGMKELVITGRNFNILHEAILSIFMPGRVLIVSATPDQGIPLLTGKDFSGETRGYLCENYVCHPPVTDLSSLIQLIES
jgi:uncharacterized protein YyaL (SSP411 family)